MKDMEESVVPETLFLPDYSMFISQAEIQLSLLNYGMSLRLACFKSTSGYVALEMRFPDQSRAIVNVPEFPAVPLNDS